MSTRKTLGEGSTSPHTYRHSRATFVRNRGAPFDMMQLLLEHADPRTTQLYARLVPSDHQAYDLAMSAVPGMGSRVYLVITPHAIRAPALARGIRLLVVSVLVDHEGPGGREERLRI